MKNSATIVLLSFSLAVFMQSCKKTPLPCFVTNPEEDSIHVNTLVTFSSLCTRDGKSFYWEFYEGGDSIEFGEVVTKTFYDTGTVKVYLFVTNGNKSSSVTKRIRVNP
ncbi:MAG: hypothetical protein NTY88_14020 [Bacteroidetes bacterium]|nr:hypothetical protein [Bacteroidota bacterium]